MLDFFVKSCYNIKNYILLEESIMEEKRIFQMGTITLDELVRLLEQYLSVNKHLTTQKFNFDNRAILQCMDSDSSWKQFLGLDAALTIELIESENNTLTVTIGNAKWLDKVGVAAVGALFFSPLLIAAGIGAVRQAVLPTEILSFIETKTGTPKTASFTKTQAAPEPDPEDVFTCPCCGSQVLKSYAFCSNCGTKL